MAIQDLDGPAYLPIGTRLCTNTPLDVHLQAAFLTLFAPFLDATQIWKQE